MHLPIIASSKIRSDVRIDWRLSPPGYPGPAFALGTIMLDCSNPDLARCALTLDLTAEHIDHLIASLKAVKEALPDNQQQPAPRAA